MPYEYTREPLTQYEATQLANACEDGDERAVVWTLPDTGLRVSELTGLRREHIDWQKHRLVISGKGGSNGPRSKRRVVPMTARVRALLEPHCSRNEGFGLGSRTAQRLVKRVANRAALARPVTPLVLRHTFAVTAGQMGISLPTLQRILGHEYLSTTQINLNLSPEEVLGEFQRKW